MGKNSTAKPITDDVGHAVKSLFSADNPFRRKPSPELPLNIGGPVSSEERKHKLDEEAALVPKKTRLEETETNPSSSPDPNPSKKNKSQKRKRDDIEEKYERKVYGAEENEEEEAVPVTVGQKRKADDVASGSMAYEEEKDPFDDESKLIRTVFVGNLPLKTRRKLLAKEFARFGTVESVRIRSVPLQDSKIPRKAAVMKGKINDAIDSVHAYIVFEDEQSANSSLAHNMALFGGNHIRVDKACPPRKKLKGDQGPLYDRKRTVFVGNLPFDVKDEELYQLFCGVSESESSVEAVRVIRDPNTSLGKGIAYVLFKSREAANSTVRRRNLKIRNRLLRVLHAKPSDTTTLGKRQVSESNWSNKGPQKNFESSASTSDRPKAKASNLSYQGLRSSKSGVPKKAKLGPRPNNNDDRKRKVKSGLSADEKSARKAKRPAVAARKAKQQLKKRKLEKGTPENTHKSKKPRKH